MTTLFYVQEYIGGRWVDLRTYDTPTNASQMYKELVKRQPHAAMRIVEKCKNGDFVWEQTSTVKTGKYRPRAPTPVITQREAELTAQVGQLENYVHELERFIVAHVPPHLLFGIGLAPQDPTPAPQPATPPPATAKALPITALRPHNGHPMPWMFGST